jgi:competence protein ComEC
VNLIVRLPAFAVTEFADTLVNRSIKANSIGEPFMNPKKGLTPVLCGIVFLLCSAALQAAPRTLDIYFIDVEGGAATLIVTPLGESLLIDSGFPGERDSGRIAHVARDVAGLTQIDHYITTHWHRDHVGGIPDLSKLIPVKHFYDHGLPATLTPDILPENIAAYRQTVQGQSVVLKPGDLLKVRAAMKSLPPLQIRVMAANGIVLGEHPGAPQIKPCGPKFDPRPEDKTDNANSIGFLLTFGAFKFFDGGDLSWNVEDKLVCPKNLVGLVDVWQVDHHGTDPSSNPELVRALKPRVAIIDNGPRKGADARPFSTLKSVPEIEAIYQLHRNVRTTEKDNAPPEFVANDDEACKGEFIKVAVASDGKSYTVSIPAKNISRKYGVR